MNYRLFNKLSSGQLIIFGIIISIYIFLIFSSLIHYVVWTKIVDKEYFIFFDWQTIIFFNQCQYNNIDVYALKVCDKSIFPYPMMYNYGPSFLWLPFPFFENLNFLYLKLVPIILIFLFVYLVIRIIDPKSKISYILTFLILMNPGTIQLVEKFNFDLIVFLITILIIYSNRNILNSMLILIMASVKFYPIVIIYKFIFLNEKFNKFILYTLITFVIFLFYFYINIEDIKKIFMSDLLKNMTVGAKNFYIFSINDYLLDRKDEILKLPESIHLLDIYKIIENKLLNIILFAVLIIFFSKLFFKKKLLKNNYFEIKTQMFMISSIILITTYLIHPNVFYREIFIILLVPLLYNFHKKYKGIFTYFMYFLITKYLLYFLIIVSDNNLFNSYIVTGFINTFLPLLDFVFMSFITSMFIIFNYKLFNYYNINNKLKI